MIAASCRPISPLAWLPLGLILFQKSEPAALFAIAICSMWPTVINTAVGVRSISQDYLNVGRVLKLSRFKTLTKIVIPASLPYVFTGYRLSLADDQVDASAGLGAGRGRGARLRDHDRREEISRRRLGFRGLRRSGQGPQVIQAW